MTAFPGVAQTFRSAGRAGLNACTTFLLLASAASATPLIDSVKGGDRAGVRRLLQEKANVNAREADGTTALHWAVRADDQ